MPNIQTLAVADELPAQERSERTARVVHWMVTAGSLVSLAWLSAFWTLVLRARFAVGRWPRAQHGIPTSSDFELSTIDPKAFGLHASLAQALLLAMFVVIPVVTVVLMLGVPFSRLRIGRSTVTAFAVASILAVATIWLDPFGFFVWFMD